MPRGEPPAWEEGSGVDDQERWYAAACAALEIGPARLRRLRQRFGSWRAVWTAGPDAWGGDGVRPETLASWQARYRPDAPWHLQEACARHRITLLAPGDAAFPARLEELKAPPTVLYLRGDPGLL